MLRLLPLFSILHIVCCSCPSWFDLVKDGECRGMYSNQETMYYDQALNHMLQNCQNNPQIRGLPIMIHTAEQQSYWLNWKGPNGEKLYDEWPIGLTCNATTKVWEWIDGSALDFLPDPRYSDDLQSACMDGCVWMMRKNGGWYKRCGHTQMYPAEVFCVVQLHQPDPAEEDCERVDDDDEDGVCYQIGAKAASWMDSQMFCRSAGSDVAAIHDDQTNSFVRRLAVSKGAVNGLYLGATRSGSAADFGWLDGSAWDFHPYYPGYPKDGLGDCLVMDTYASSGKWENMNCSTTLPVACARDARAAEQPTCKPGPYKDSGIITSPGYPFSAATPCDYFIAVTGTRIKAQITLEANSCCDFLVIYDDYLEGKVIANLTGFVNATYTYNINSDFMRVSWQPNGGVNVRGLAMQFS